MQLRDAIMLLAGMAVTGVLFLVVDAICCWTRSKHPDYCKVCDALEETWAHHMLHDHYVDERLDSHGTWKGRSSNAGSQIHK